MEKSKDAFRTISEVAEWLDVPTHVLRFWESRFTQIKPVKRAGGRRYYRPTDMALLGGIKRLLHDDGLTIRGVQKLLRERGVRHVAALSPTIDGVPAPLPPAPSGSRKSKQDAPPDRWPFADEAQEPEAAPEPERPAAEARPEPDAEMQPEPERQDQSAGPQPAEPEHAADQPHLPGTESVPEPEPASNVTPFAPAAKTEPDSPVTEPDAPEPSAPEPPAATPHEAAEPAPEDPADPAGGATVAPAAVTLLRHVPRERLATRAPALKSLHDRLAALRAGPSGDNAG